MYRVPSPPDIRLWQSSPFPVQRGLLRTRFLSLSRSPSLPPPSRRSIAIRADGEENFGMPRNFIGILSVSPKREKRYPRHTNTVSPPPTLPPSRRWETFIPAVPPT